MTTRRALLLRAGVVAALAVGTFLLPAAPAYAVADLRIQNIAPVTLMVGGGPQPLILSVKNQGADAGDATLTIDVPLSNMQVGIGDVGNCKKNGSRVTCTIKALDHDATVNFSIQLMAPASSSLPPGGKNTQTGTAVLDAGSTQSFNVTLRAPDQAPPPVVSEVSGTVLDESTGAPVGNALVLLQDGARHESNTGTDGQGHFRFGPDKQIVPGTLTLGASRDGYDNKTVTKDATAGQSATGITIKLKAKAATGSPTPPASEAPTAADTQSPAAAADNTVATRNTGSDTGLFSWVLIGLGALLVLLGIGAIVLLLIRRKDDQGDPDDELDDPRPTRHGPAPVVPAGQGVYHGGTDPTTLARPALDEPTALMRTSRPPVDPYADPYAAPPTTPRTAYPTGANPTAYAGPASPGYGDTAGYAGSAGYRGPGADEPTGRHNGGYPPAGAGVGWGASSGRHDVNEPDPYGYESHGGQHARPDHEPGRHSDDAPTRRANPAAGNDRRSRDWLDD